MPAAEEMALFDRIGALIRGEDNRFDLIVFDTAPTGHTLRLIRMPELMEAWIRALSRSRRAMLGIEQDDRTDPMMRSLSERLENLREFRARLLSPRMTAFVLVLIAEQLPVRLRIVPGAEGTSPSQLVAVADPSGDDQRRRPHARAYRSQRLVAAPGVAGLQGPGVLHRRHARSLQAGVARRGPPAGGRREVREQARLQQAPARAPALHRRGCRRSAVAIQGRRTTEKRSRS